MKKKIRRQKVKCALCKPTDAHTISELQECFIHTSTATGFGTHWPISWSALFYKSIVISPVRKRNVHSSSVYDLHYLFYATVRDDGPVSPEKRSS